MVVGGDGRMDDLIMMFDVLLINCHMLILECSGR